MGSSRNSGRGKRGKIKHHLALRLPGEVGFDANFSPQANLSLNTANGIFVIELQALNDVV